MTKADERIERLRERAKWLEEKYGHLKEGRPVAELSAVRWAIDELTKMFVTPSAAIGYDERRVEELCLEIGFGRVMQCASKLWRERAAREGQPSAGIVTGPHHGLTVPCFCRRVPRGDPNHHERPGGCDWCCGCGWLTKAVANMIEHG